ncbi:type IV secretory system conjugative DNA transfer family protein [Eubacteriales bacterium KG125]
MNGQIDLNDILYKFIYIGIFILILIVIIKLLLIKFKGGRFTSNEKINRSIKGSLLSLSNKPVGFIFGFLKKKQVYLPNTSEGHITVFGGSGKGKTSALLVPSLRAWDASFFAIDISGDISKNVHIKRERKIILEPENPDQSAIYNVFYFIDKAKTEDEKRQKLEQLVNLIVEIPEKASDAQLYFAETGRKIFLSGLLAFYDIGLDFTEICKTIFFNTVPELAELIATTKNDLAIGYIKSLAGENEKNISGAKSALNRKIKLFADNLSMEKMLRREYKGEYSFNPSDLEDKCVFLKVSDKKQEYYNPFIHIVVAQTLEYISSRVYDPKVDQRILLAIDEFASIGYLNVLSPFRKFRKNGANLCILTQSLADIDLVYSEKERQVILDNSQYIAILGAVDNKTREYFSNLIGKEVVIKKSRSTGKSGDSISTSKQREFAIEPEEWKDLGENIIVIHPSGFIKLKKNYYYKSRDKSKKWRLS